MLWLLLGALVLFLLLGGMRAFEQASVTSIKSLLAWVVALGGLTLALLLILTGRGGMALGGLALFGPLIWQKWREARNRQSGNRQSGPGASTAQPPPNRSGTMTRDEAYQVLGLRPGASKADIRAAHRRLMRGAHPDAGGSDWLASRVNEARDILLG
jgi:DnaJ homolog subfamily C member 19